MRAQAIKNETNRVNRKKCTDNPQCKRNGQRNNSYESIIKNHQAKVAKVNERENRIFFSNIQARCTKIHEKQWEISRKEFRIVLYAFSFKINDKQVNWTKLYEFVIWQEISIENSSFLVFIRDEYTLNNVQRQKQKPTTTSWAKDVRKKKNCRRNTDETFF